ncbi:uncharacterized protein LOC134298906 [Anolis carolinensis]|uniref:uncharacterized protein LOC134298906 n=1 Tax=Anolis carolinensis TaxID=28377 RepID=UPI002F2B67A3
MRAEGSRAWRPEEAGLWRRPQREGVCARARPARPSFFFSSNDEAWSSFASFLARARETAARAGFPSNSRPPSAAAALSLKAGQGTGSGGRDRAFSFFLSAPWPSLSLRPLAIFVQRPPQEAARDECAGRPPLGTPSLPSFLPPSWPRASARARLPVGAHAPWGGRGKEEKGRKRRNGTFFSGGDFKKGGRGGKKNIRGNGARLTVTRAWEEAGGARAYMHARMRARGRGKVRRARRRERACAVRAGRASPQPGGGEKQGGRARLAESVGMETRGGAWRGREPVGSALLWGAWARARSCWACLSRALGSGGAARAKEAGLSLSGCSSCKAKRTAARTSF